jgi:MarR family transcriptional regulator, organic hydroperoxide resistance regulator
MSQTRAASRTEEVEALLRSYPRIFFACHRRHVRDPATRRVLSAHQASILDHLDEVDGMALSDLARHMGVTPGTMSVAIDRLARKGYVRRTRSRDDQRRVELRLTDAGLRIRSQQSVLEPELIELLLAELTTTERGEGLRGLELLAEAADRMMARKAARGTRSLAKTTTSTSRRR